MSNLYHELVRYIGEREIHNHSLRDYLLSLFYKLRRQNLEVIYTLSLGTLLMFL